MTPSAIATGWWAMEPSRSPEPSLTPVDGQRLVDMAESAIAAALRRGSTGRADPAGHQPPLSTLPPALRQPAGAFVTLRVDTALNGCIGTVRCVEPLGHLIGRLALAAAFHDPRLPPLRATDLARLHVEVSVLGEPAPVPAGSRADLLGQLRPGRHGLVLEAGARRGVFLPSVWQQVRDPGTFVDRLLAKAGLAAEPWPLDLAASTFTARSFHGVTRHST